MANRPWPMLSSPALPILMLIVLLSYMISSRTSAQLEVEDEREFDYDEDSPLGPSRWGYLREEWRTCKTGRKQSPINITSDRVREIRETRFLQRNYVPAEAIIKNRGHDISVQWEAGQAGSIKVNGADYTLRQCHWHTPSEHNIDNRSYDMELHMVHVSSDPTVEHSIAVIGLLYEHGPPDHFIKELTGDLRRMIHNGLTEIPAGVIDPRKITMPIERYYRYMGSLTTPPCTEGVIWIINKKVMTVSNDQVSLLRKAVHDYARYNARPLQPLNNRDIYLHKTDHAGGLLSTERAELESLVGFPLVGEV